MIRIGIIWKLLSYLWEFRILPRNFFVVYKQQPKFLGNSFCSLKKGRKSPHFRTDGFYCFNRKYGKFWTLLLVSFSRVIFSEIWLFYREISFFENLNTAVKNRSYYVDLSKIQVFILNVWSFYWYWFWKKVKEYTDPL